MKLPKKMTHQRVLILKLLAGNKGPMSCAEIKQALPPERKHRVEQAVYQMYVADQLERDAGTTDGLKYSLAKLGKYILANLDKINQFEPTRIPRKPIAKKKASTSPKVAAPVKESPPPPQFNISVHAEQLSNNISAVLYENEQYRNLLLQLHETIGRSLGLDQSKENKE